MKSQLKLFVWTEFCPDYSGGLAFAIAKDEAEARRLVEAEHGYEISNSDWGTLEVLPLKAVAYALSGGA